MSSLTTYKGLSVVIGNILGKGFPWICFTDAGICKVSNSKQPPKAQSPIISKLSGIMRLEK